VRSVPLKYFSRTAPETAYNLKTPILWLLNIGGRSVLCCVLLDWRLHYACVKLADSKSKTVLPSFTARNAPALDCQYSAVDRQRTALAGDRVESSTDRQRTVQDVSTVIERGAQRAAIVPRGSVRASIPSCIWLSLLRLRGARSIASRTGRNNPNWRQSGPGSSDQNVLSISFHSPVWLTST